jgi:hypothetical protein
MITRPNGLSINWPQARRRYMSKTNDLVREAVGWNDGAEQS